jgi:hypothetical protein
MSEREKRVERWRAREQDSKRGREKGEKRRG